MKLSYPLVFLKERVQYVLCAVLLCLLAGVNASAQTGTAVLRGSVIDSQGKAVQGATVKLTNAEKNYNRVQSTNDEGGYVFSAIPPGIYSIDVEAAGFKKVSVNE